MGATAPNPNGAVASSTAPAPRPSGGDPAGPAARESEAASRPVVLDARGEAPWRIVGGIPLVTRLARSFELAGFLDLHVVVDGEASVRDVGSRGRQTRLTLHRLERETPLAPLLRRLAGSGTAVAVDAAFLVDRRLVAALASCRGPELVAPPAGETHVGLALVDGASAARFGAPLPPDGPLPVLDPARLPTFSLEMRGETPILYRALRSASAAREATDVLVRATQKHVMDAPARWIDPPVENTLVRWLAPTFVTPNQITIACTLLGFFGAALLWHGQFALALPVLYAVGWLDGVDGKLARLRLHYSPLGAGESYFDFAYENAWWIALAAGLSDAGHVDAAGWGTALVLGNLLDEIAYTIGHARLGIALDLLSPADGAFRLVAGRRNIYVAILLGGTLLGSPYAGLVAMGAWAVVTGVVHAVRLVVALRAPARRDLPA